MSLQRLVSLKERGGEKGWLEVPLPHAAHLRLSERTCPELGLPAVFPPGWWQLQPPAAQAPNLAIMGSSLPPTPGPSATRAALPLKSIQELPCWARQSPACRLPTCWLLTAGLGNWNTF